MSTDARVTERDGVKYVWFRGDEYEFKPTHRYQDRDGRSKTLMKVAPVMQTVNGMPRLAKAGGWVNEEGREPRKFPAPPVELDFRPAEVLVQPVRSDVAADFELRHAALILATTLKTAWGRPIGFVEEAGTNTSAVRHEDGTVTITVAGQKTRVKLPARMAFERAEE